MMLNAVHAHLAEFGVLTGAGVEQAIRAVGEFASQEDLGLPDVAREALASLACLIQELQVKLSDLDKQLTRWHCQNDVSNLLETISGVGIVTASAMISSGTEPASVKSAWHFAALLGLVPRQNSSGGKTRLGGITKVGN